MIADELLIRETIDGDDVYAIIKGEFTPTDKEQWLQQQQQKQQELDAKKSAEEESQANENLTNEGGSIQTA